MQRSPVMVKFQQHSREKPDTAGGWMVALRYAHKNRRHQTMCQPLNKYLLLPVASQLRQMEQKLEHRPLTQRQSQQTTLYCTFFFVSSYFLFLVLLLENVESLIKNYFFLSYLQMQYQCSICTMGLAYSYFVPPRICTSCKMGIPNLCPTCQEEEEPSQCAQCTPRAHICLSHCYRNKCPFFELTWAQRRDRFKTVQKKSRPGP